MIQAPRSFRTLILAALVTLLQAAPVGAQPDTTAVEVEIERDALSLRDVVRPVPEDRDRVDTALVYTNSAPRIAVVRCSLLDSQGAVVGRFRVKLPGKGLRYVLASDAAHGRDFVGSAQCTTPGHVIGSAFLLAPGLTDLPVQQTHSDGLVRMRFPVVATY